MSDRRPRSGSRFQLLPDNAEGDDSFLASPSRAPSIRSHSFSSTPYRRTSYERPKGRSFRSSSLSATLFPPKEEQQSEDFQFKWDHYARVPQVQEDSGIEDVSGIFGEQEQSVSSDAPANIAEDVEILRNIGFFIDYPNGKLGSGTFGVVYRGYYGMNVENFQDVESSRRFAVKVVDFSQGFDASDKENFETEKYILTKVFHKNVVSINTIINMGEQHLLTFTDFPDSRYTTWDRAYLIMDYADLGDLESWLSKNQESFEPSTRLAFMRDMFFGMHYLHQNKIVHGDVHVGNVLIFIGIDGDLVAKWSDFGLSNIAGKERKRVVTDEYFRERASFDINNMITMYDEILENREMCRPETPQETDLLDKCQQLVDDNYGQRFESIEEFFVEFQPILEEELAFDEHHFD